MNPIPLNAKAPHTGSKSRSKFTRHRQKLLFALLFCTSIFLPIPSIAANDEDKLRAVDHTIVDSDKFEAGDPPIVDSDKFGTVEHPVSDTDKFGAVEYPVIDYGIGEKAERIKRGEYLVKVGDCIACHTAPGGKPFAGGLAIEIAPFGTIFSQNITADKETGIGKWTDDQFVTAMREGIDPEGHYYYAAFPYPYFNKLSRKDVLDIKAYLEAIPAVHAPNKPLEFHFPFNIRLLQSFWRFMFFDGYRGEFKSNEKQSPEWNRGAYLVDGLGHCSMCHTPMNPIGGPIRKYAFTGGFVEGYSAPNISASALKDVPVEKIVNVFLKDELIRGGKVQGPMLQVNHDSLRYLEISDLEAIAIYLKSIESELPPPPATGKGDKAGKVIYLKYCAGCHDQGGGGAPKFGDVSAWAPLIKMGQEQMYNNAIRGIRGMPPKGNCASCTDEQVHQAVDYIVNRSKPASGEEVGVTAPVESPTSLAKGKRVYDNVCFVCHTGGELGAPKLGDKAAWEPLIEGNNIDVLVERAIHGYKGHPPKGACNTCTSADIIAAVKYMAEEGSNGNYSLW
ncbi:MAG: Gluconate 2-dehydrogenase cytochrome c subunit [Gammaproteobacteria bacterium]|jgi:cytochrome c5|nr:Gluconate 2-dehydrogenase cytochrome c subunit [Gammaproteobacteria bacterium]